MIVDGVQSHEIALMFGTMPSANTSETVQDQNTLIIED